MVIQFIFKLLFEMIAGYLLADLIVGIFHWIKDTYFSPFTPLIGKSFVWASRLHHLRPRYVLEFSDIELFIDSAKWASIWIIPLMLITGISVFNVTLFLMIGLNDVIHKYAHMFDTERPQWASILQKNYIIQSHDEHHLHHVHPHEINYCPITPYINVILEKINFWRFMELFVERTIGVKPREKEYEFVEDPLYPASIKFLP